MHFQHAFAMFSIAFGLWALVFAFTIENQGITNRQVYVIVAIVGLVVVTQVFVQQRRELKRYRKEHDFLADAYQKQQRAIGRMDTEIWMLSDERQWLREELFKARDELEEHLHPKFKHCCNGS